MKTENQYWLTQYIVETVDMVEKTPYSVSQFTTTRGLSHAVYQYIFNKVIANEQAKRKVRPFIAAYLLHHSGSVVHSLGDL